MKLLSLLLTGSISIDLSESFRFDTKHDNFFIIASFDDFTPSYHPFTPPHLSLGAKFNTVEHNYLSIRMMQKQFLSDL